MAAINLEVNIPNNPLDVLKDIKKGLQEVSEAREKDAQVADKTGKDIVEDIVETDKALKAQKKSLDDIAAALDNFKKAASGSMKSAQQDVKNLSSDLAKLGAKGIFNEDEVEFFERLSTQGKASIKDIDQALDLIQGKISSLGGNPDDYRFLVEFAKGFESVAEAAKEYQQVISDVTTGSGKNLFSVEEINQASQSLSVASDNADLLSRTIEVLTEKQNQFAVGSKEYDVLGSKIADLNNAMFQLNRTSEGTEVTQKTLLTRLREIREEMTSLAFAGQQNTQRYKDLSAEGAKLQNTIRNINSEMKLMSSNTRALDSTIGVLTEITAAFGIVHGAAALFGKENENIAKSIQKVTGIIAILNSLQQIQLALTRSNSAATKIHTAVTNAYTWAQSAANTQLARFRALMVTTGIGALVVALGVLINKIMSVGDAAKQASDELDRFFGMSDDSLDELNKKTQQRFELLRSEIEARGGTVAEFAKIDREALVQEKKNLEDRIKQDEQLFKLQSYTRAKSEEEFIEFNNRMAERRERLVDLEHKIQVFDNKEKGRLLKERNKISSSSNKDYLKDLEKFNSDLIKFSQDAAKAQAEIISDEFLRNETLRRQALDNELKQLDAHYKMLASSKIISSEQLKKLTEDYNIIQAALQEKFNNESIEANKLYHKNILEEQRKLQDLILEVNGTQQDIEMQQLRNKFQDIKNEYTKAGLDISSLIEKQAEEERDIRLKYALDEIKTQQELNEAVINSIQMAGASQVKAEQAKANLLRIAQAQSSQAELDAIRRRFELEKQLSNENIEQYKKYVEDQINVNKTPLSIFDFFQISGLTPEQKLQIQNALNETIGEVAKEAESLIKSFSDGGGGLDIGKGLIALFGVSDENGDLARSLNQTVDMIRTAYDQIYQAAEDAERRQIALIDKRIDKIIEQIDEQESAVDKEKSLAEKGYANNFEIENKRLQDLKQRQDEEVKIKDEATAKLVKLQKQQAIANYAAQTAALITAAANIIESWSSVPYVGVVLGLAAAGAMVTGFISLQNQLKNISAQTFESGGEADIYDLLKGRRSHKRGGVGLYDGLTKIAEFEGDEKLFVMNKRSGTNPDNLPILDAINRNDDNSLRRIFKTRFDRDTPSRTYSLQVEDKKNHYHTIVNPNNEDISSIARTNKEMLDIEKRKKRVRYEGGYKITESDGRTTKIKMND